MNVDRKADIVAAFGASGSGKTWFIKKALERLQGVPIVAVDPDGEYSGQGAITSSLVDVVNVMKAPTFRIRFRPSSSRKVAEEQFGFICDEVRRLIYPKGRPMVLLVDELADLVGSSFRESPDSWQWCLRRGRKYGLSILAASQRPAMIDKTLFDLATVIRTGWLNTLDSQRTVAAAIGVKLEEVQALDGHEWIAMDKNAPKASRLTRSAPAPAAAHRAARGSRARAKK